VGCVNSIACAKTADLQAEPTLRTPQARTWRSLVPLLVPVERRLHQQTNGLSPRRLVPWCLGAAAPA
jgi:hypothetical protein